MTILVALLTSFVRAWLAMLFLGVIHHDLDARVPALGYFTTLLLTVVVGLMVTRGDES